ncbi:MAG: glycerol-3-phosphate dehydrogenase/oxidase [Bdellovibrionia bacterium]
MKTQLSALARSKFVKTLTEEEYDLLIIGGGITGAGAARDAAMRGMKVALVEAHDFASGTSSRSSKLIHGGIRYLENLEFKLVFEALNERSKLFEMVPHLVHPLRFMLPLYENSRVGMFKMGLGMWLYDALALFQVPEMHEQLNAFESLERIPAINSMDLKGSFVYSDGYMDDDRLVHETLRSAVEYGATVVNYVKAISRETNLENTVQSISCEDTLLGQKFRIKAKHVISAVGPWTDLFGESFLKDWKRTLRPTKGIHLTFKKERIELPCAVVMAAEKSSRIVFAIPRHEMVIVGTTDTDFKGDPSQVAATKEDVDYLLKITNEYFPGAQLTVEDVIASYAGVRPLIADDAESEGKTSREHAIWTERGVTFVAGGKYTTYRLMAEQVVDESINHLPLDLKIRFTSANTATALNEWTHLESYQQALSTCEQWNAKKLSYADKLRLAERYGLEAKTLVESYGNQFSYWQIEAIQAIHTTMCLNLVDFYTRRVPLVLADPQHGLQLLEEISTIFSYYLNWDSNKLKEEVANLKAYLAKEMAWKGEALKES